MKLRDLKEKRAALVDSQRAILDAAEKESRELTADEVTSYENIQTEFDQLSASVQREESLILREQTVNAPGPTPSNRQQPASEDDEERKKALKSEAFFAFARKGHRAFNGPRGQEYRNALEVGTDSEGGYLVPEAWEAGMIKDMAEINVIRRLSRVSSSSTLTNLPIRTSRGTFTWIAEEGTYSTNDPAYGNIQLGAHKVGGIILVSEELLQDNQYNLAGELQFDATEEFAEKEEAAFATGDNSGKPEGIFAVTAVGGTNLVGKAAASTTAVTADELIDTYHTLGRKYRDRATWLCGDAFAKNVRKLKDADNQYLWQPGLTGAEPDRLLGRPFEVSDSGTTPRHGRSLRSLW